MPINPSAETFESALLALEGRENTAEKVRSLGKLASSAFLNNQVPLNDSIRKLASDQNLKPEQIKRVCEEANTSTFLELFKTAEDKNIQFPMADPKTVLTSLEKTACAAPRRGVNDYSLPPEREHVAGYKLMKTAAAEAWKTGYGRESEDYEFDHNTPKVKTAWIKVAHAVQHLESAQARLDSVHDYSQREFIREFSDEWGKGTSLAEIKTAMERSIDDPEFVKSAFISAIGSLRDKGALTKEAANKEPIFFIEKTANAPVDFEHPLIKSFVQYHASSNEKIKVATALSTLAEQKSELQAMMNKLAKVKKATWGGALKTVGSAAWRGKKGLSLLGGGATSMHFGSKAVGDYSRGRKTRLLSEQQKELQKEQARMRRLGGGY